jgi:hypothetical protein
MQEQPTWCGAKNASGMLVYSKEYAFPLSCVCFLSAVRSNSGVSNTCHFYVLLFSAAPIFDPLSDCQPVKTINCTAGSNGIHPSMVQDLS